MTFLEQKCHSVCPPVSPVSSSDVRGALPSGQELEEVFVLSKKKKLKLLSVSHVLLKNDMATYLPNQNINI